MKERMTNVKPGEMDMESCLRERTASGMSRFKNARSALLVVEKRSAEIVAISESYLETGSAPPVGKPFSGLFDSPNKGFFVGSYQPNCLS